MPKGAKVSIGCDSLVHCRISFDSNQGQVIVGDRSYLGLCNLVCYRRIEIGNDVMIAWGVTIVDHNSHSLSWEQRKDDVANWRAGTKNWDNVAHAPVIIKDKAWIGFNVSILKGVTIGEGAVVGACAVVAKDVPPFTLVAGNPASVIRTLN
jgi:galactoside O-acetyltransferase